LLIGVHLEQVLTQGWIRQATRIRAIANVDGLLPGRGTAKRFLAVSADVAGLVAALPCVCVCFTAEKAFCGLDAASRKVRQFAAPRTGNISACFAIWLGLGAAAGMATVALMWLHAPGYNLPAAGTDNRSYLVSEYAVHTIIVWNLPRTKSH
jgi:hypothetical protein